LTLIFGIMGVINLAHGSFYMLGAYLAFALAPWFSAGRRPRSPGAPSGNLTATRGD
jgi:branched-subunit amino acid ABC-type transport system permease component